MAAHLVIYKDEKALQDLNMQETTTIGRKADNDIVIDHPSVSRYHAQILRRPNGQFIIEDRGSRNGTSVNNEPLPSETSRLLANGDTITLSTADVHLIFYDETATRPLAVKKRRISINEKCHEVSINGRLLEPPLTQNQYHLLLLLYRRAGEVCARDEIIQAVWPDAKGGVTDEAIDALVKRLRQRFAELDPETEFVVTVPRHGFRLV